MNRKTTFLSLKCLFALLVVQTVDAQQIYTNGGLSTGATAENLTAAPTGYTWSEVQHETGNTTESNTNSGYGATYNNALSTNNALADDFTVPVGSVWNTTSFEFYAYQTGAAATPIPFDQLRVQIYNGDPAAGGTVIAGNFTTNVLDVAASSDALMYRIFNSVVPTAAAPGTTRKIWKLVGNLNATLPAGTYWVAFQAHCTNDAGAFFPSVTIAGTRGLPGWNAKQSTLTVPAYTIIFDAGNPATAPDVNQDLPFNINGTVTLGVKQNDFASTILVYPNPVKNVVSLSSTSDALISGVEIVDVNGRTVKSVAGEASTQINVSDLSSGVYFMNIRSDKGTATKKIVKE